MESSISACKSSAADIAKRANGEIEFHHSILAATLVASGHAMVLPLMLEFIVNPDGAEKQDCVRDAAKRWLAAYGERMAPLRPVHLGGDLSRRRSSIPNPLPKSKNKWACEIRGEENLELPRDNMPISQRRKYALTTTARRPAQRRRRSKQACGRVLSARRAGPPKGPPSCCGWFLPE
jgi:hypothetical protein